MSLGKPVCGWARRAKQQQGQRQLLALQQPILRGYGRGSRVLGDLVVSHIVYKLLQNMYAINVPMDLHYVLERLTKDSPRFQRLGGKSENESCCLVSDMERHENF